MTIGREDLDKSVLNQDINKMFSKVDSFYFLEPTQKEGEFEMYFANKNEKNEDEQFVHRVAIFYNYETAKYVMNTLNKKNWKA